MLLTCIQTGKLHAGAGELEAAEAALAKASSNAAPLQKQLAPNAPEAAREEAATALFKLFLARMEVSWRLQQSVRACADGLSLVRAAQPSAIADRQSSCNMQALASTLLARATELARSSALSTWQRFSLSVELINAEVEQAATLLESEQVQAALALLTSAHQHLSDGA